MKTQERQRSNRLDCRQLKLIIFSKSEEVVSTLRRYVLAVVLIVVIRDRHYSMAVIPFEI